ncbi:MAG: FAD-binding protein, partial [Granulosicoccaceae bacterium]
MSLEKPINPMEPALRQRLIDALSSILPAHCLKTEDSQLRPYESDGLAVYRRRPAVVALPETVEQVQQVMRLCRDLDIPVVARGAGTGLSGGALPRPDGLTLGLGKFNKILHVDADNTLAVVQPGVRNLAISEAAAPYGLYYAPDPSSQIACSIGGNVAENAGGVHCLKYGLTVHNVVQVKVVTIDGELLSIGGLSLDTPGYDLLALMHGSEGLLAVVVEVTVKLLPSPPVAKVLLAAFDDVQKAGDTVAAIIGAGIIPAGLEMMDSAAIVAAEAFAKCGYPTDAAALFLCELDGSAAEVAELMAQVIEIVEAGGATEHRVAADETERAKLWKGRKSAFPAVGRLSPDYY